ncbi:MAG: ferredoxin [Gaiellaceae bacterium]
MFRIEIDRSLCSGFGSCLDAAPELIELGADGIAAARVEATGDPAAIAAAHSCPVGAITWRPWLGRHVRNEHWTTAAAGSNRRP